MKDKKKDLKKEKLRILAAAAGALLILLLFLAGAVKLLSGYETVKTAAARKTIEKGTQITEENAGQLFVIRETDRAMLPEGTVTTLEELKGKVLSETLWKNEIVTRKDLSDRALVEASMEEPTELTFTATSIADSAGGTVRSGDAINVGILYQTDTGQSRYRLAGEDIYVAEALDDSGRPVSGQKGEAACTMFRVIMERREAEQLLETIRDGDETIVTLPRS